MDESEKTFAEKALGELMEMRANGQNDTAKLRALADRIQLRSDNIGFSSKAVSDPARSSAWLAVKALLQAVETRSGDLPRLYGQAISQTKLWIGALG